MVLAYNAVGKQNGVTVGGYSRTVDPWDEVVVEAGAEDGITAGDLDLAAVAPAQAQFPVLRDQRLPTPLPPPCSNSAIPAQEGGHL